MSTVDKGSETVQLPSLDLLLDVELEATIRFGGRQLPLREILSMSVGSVVELDKRIDEPAELFVAGRLIAKGEVVVVDGCFGLRVTEVVNAPDPAQVLPS
jgi:flagellar motor switch protein FliN/FliY